MNNLTSPAAQIILNFATCVKPVYHERWRSCSIRYLFDSDCSNVTQMGQLFKSYYGSSIIPSLMHGIGIGYVQHSQAKLERRVC